MWSLGFKRWPDIHSDLLWCMTKEGCSWPYELKMCSSQKAGRFWLFPSPFDPPIFHKSASQNFAFLLSKWAKKFSGHVPFAGVKQQLHSVKTRSRNETFQRNTFFSYNWDTFFSVRSRLYKHTNNHFWSNLETVRVCSESFFGFFTGSFLVDFFGAEAVLFHR